MSTDDRALADLRTCPFCGTGEHLSTQSVGVMTGDMPDRPYRIVCTHLDHDTVTGPVAYGKIAAISAWNTRPADRLEAFHAKPGVVVCPVCKDASGEQQCAVCSGCGHLTVEEAATYLAALQSPPPVVEEGRDPI